MTLEKTTLQKLILSVRSGWDFTGTDISVQDLKDMKNWVIDRWETEWAIAGFQGWVPSVHWVAESEETLAQIRAELATRTRTGPYPTRTRD